MEATGATQLNPAQLNILRLMSYIDTEQEQNELLYRHGTRAE